MMIAREINSRVESGALKLDDNWEGIKYNKKAATEIPKTKLVSTSTETNTKSGSCC